jgi:hypothetical protein
MPCFEFRDWAAFAQASTRTDRGRSGAATEGADDCEENGDGDATIEGGCGKDGFACPRSAAVVFLFLL